MSLKIFQSHDYYLFSKELSELILKEKQSVFNTEYIVYQTRGIRSWLPIELAGKNGIFAGAQFIPFNKLEELLYDKVGIIESHSLSSKVLVWKFYKYFNEKEFKDEFPLIASYYENDDMKRIQLSIQVGNLFDKYLDHREEMLKDWLRKDFKSVDNEHVKWQSFLWRKVIDSDPDLKIAFYLKDDFIVKLENKEVMQLIKDIFPRLFFFGFLTLSKRQLQLISYLEKIIDVYLFLYSPSNEIQNNTNELIKYLGNNRKESHGILFGSLGNYKNLLSDNKYIFPNTVLGKIQSDIVNGNFTENLNEIADGSIQINSCYTPVRELESLYNHLLELSNKNKELLPKDILVLIPDIDSYAPYIKAVFDSNLYIYNFPYSIDGMTYSGNDTAAGILNTLLAFTEQEFTSENIMQLLEHSRIADVFGITDLEQIRGWLREANIRCGMNGAGDKENETYMVSFRYGLMRLIYGFALGEDEQYKSDENLFEAPKGQDVYPVGTFNGSSDLLELCRFKSFVDVLHKMIELRKENRTTKDWVEYVRNNIVFSLLYNSDEINKDVNEENEESVPVNYLDRILYEFASNLSDSEEIISYSVFSSVLSGYINAEIREGKNSNGGITFASYNSRQGIPFKVIAVLGMNYDTLPRKQTSLSFDLMSNEKLPGDPNGKEQDKYTFLQTILSAKENLLLSYIGRSSKDNSKRPPSLLIEQLIDYVGIKQENPLPESMIWVQHPLHSFSTKYNNEKYPRLISFDVAEKTEQKNIPESNNKAAETEYDFSNINLNKLIAFYKDPFKVYFNKKLGYFVNEEEESLPEIETFEIGGYLEKHCIKSFLMEDRSADERKKYILQSKHNGNLPLALIAEDELIAIEEEIVEIRNSYLKLKGMSELNSKEETLSISNDTNLNGTVNLFGNKQIIYCTSSWSSTPKYLIEIWIRHLFTIAIGKNLSSYIVIKENKFNADKLVIEFNSKMITKEKALISLTELIGWYKEGHKKIFPFECQVGMPDKGKSLENVLESDFCNGLLKKALEMEIVTFDEIRDHSIRIGNKLYSQFINVLK